MKLKPQGQIDLPVRSQLLLGNRQLMLAYAENGQVFTLDLRSQTAQALSGAAKLRSPSLHPFENYLAGLDSNGFLTLHPAAARTDPPRIDPGLATWARQGCEQCLFDADGRHLWLTARSGPSTFEVCLIETHAWSLVHRETVQDEIGGSGGYLFATGRKGVVSLWLVAEDQQVVWLMKSSQGFECHKEQKLVNTTPPVFSPDGAEFLVLVEEGALRKFDFDTMQPTGNLLETEDEDDPFAESMCFLNARCALARTNEGRIFSIDVERMQVGEELALEGHETRPIGEYYPTLAREPGVATDIDWFVRVGNVIFFVFRRDKRAGLSHWQDSLAWCYAPE